MLQENQQLHSDIFADDPEVAYTRNGYGEGLLELGQKNEDVVAVCADLSGSTRTKFFQEEFPDRYIEVGVAEQNLATVGSGLAAVGKIPYISSYAAFSPGRNNEQIRTTISLNDMPVKILGAHAGVSVGPDGATHQQLEDMALMRVQPNMTVLAGCDKEETRKIVHKAAEIDGPVYFRVAREKTPVITTKDTPFEVGKANVLWESEDPDVALIASGPLVGAVTVPEGGVSGPAPGTGTATVSVVSVPDRATLEPGAYDTDVSYLEVPDAVVDVSGVTGKPVLTYSLSVPELRSRSSVFFLEPGAEGRTELSMDRLSFDPGAVDRERYTGQLRLVMRGSGGERTLYEGPIVIEVGG